MLREVRINVSRIRKDDMYGYVTGSFKYLSSKMENALKDMPTTARASAGETEPLFVTVVCKNLLDGGGTL